MREKYKLSVVSYDAPFLGEEPSYLESGFDDLIAKEDAQEVRRELAFLAKTYRDVLVLYYMKDRSVKEIAEALGIPKGTVLSRLDAGRQKMKAKMLERGESKMEKYQEKSWQPERLAMSMNGRCGMKGEPFSCVRSSMEQNILITAYEKPLTVTEIAQAMSVAAAYVEDSVNHLVAQELMVRMGSGANAKVATDFVILNIEDEVKWTRTSLEFAKETFDIANDIYMEMVGEYRKIPGFNVMNDTQLYCMAVLSARLNFEGNLAEELVGEQDFENYPDRPNYGKWIALGTRSPQHFDYNKVHTANGKSLSVSGRAGVQNISEDGTSYCEWDCAIGKTHNGQYKHALDTPTRAKAIDSIRTKTADAFVLELIPDFEWLGFIAREQDGEYAVRVPYITEADLRRFFEIESEAGHRMLDQLRQKARDVCRENAVNYPKRIKTAPSTIATNPISNMHMAYIYEAAQRGIIELQEGKNYPVMFFVTK
jgi:RNA polymerase sigma-70 factor (ECF subfamily)